MRKQLVEAIAEIKAASEKAYSYYVRVRDDFKVYRIGNQYYTDDPNMGFYPASASLMDIVAELEMYAR